MGIEPTHKGFADPFLSELSLSISMLDQGFELFCPLFVHLGRGEQTKTQTRVVQSFKPLWCREWESDCNLGLKTRNLLKIKQAPIARNAASAVPTHVIHTHTLVRLRATGDAAKTVDRFTGRRRPREPPEVLRYEDASGSTAWRNFTG